MDSFEFMSRHPIITIILILYISEMLINIVTLLIEFSSNRDIDKQLLISNEPTCSVSPTCKGCDHSVQYKTIALGQPFKLIGTDGYVCDYGTSCNKGEC